MPRKRQSSYKRNLAEEAKLGLHLGLTEPFPDGHNLAIATIQTSKDKSRITQDMKIIKQATKQAIPQKSEKKRLKKINNVTIKLQESID